MYVKNETLNLISKYTKVSHITKYASELEIYKECTSTSNIIVNLKRKRVENCLLYWEYDVVSSTPLIRSVLLSFMRHEENREEFITNMISKELKMKLK